MSHPKKENKKWFYKYIHTISSIHNLQTSIHNSLWPSDAIWYSTSWSRLVYVIDLRLTGDKPSPTLMLAYGQLDPKEATESKQQRVNTNANIYIYIYNGFGNVVCKMQVILIKTQCVNLFKETNAAINLVFKSNSINWYTLQWRNMSVTASQVKQTLIISNLNIAWCIISKWHFEKLMAMQYVG